MITTAKPEFVKFEKGGAVIPRHLCREFGIRKGVKATIVSTPEGILLIPHSRTRTKAPAALTQRRDT